MWINEMSRQASVELLARARLCRVGCSHDGQPYVTPMYCAYDGSNLYGFSTLGQKITWMRANPSVCVLADEIVSPQNWASVIVLGKYEELTDAPHLVTHRQHAYNLLQTHPVWWEPGYVETMLHGTPRLMEFLYFRIHIEQISGHRGTPDPAGLADTAAPRGTGRWFRRILGRSEEQSGDRLVIAVASRLPAINAGLE
jgi:nitroimidazol reductase NimA-like FMN-containing flavoprotein (pyridoxamine 5'-phosphate oxidase superfamily)